MDLDNLELTEDDLRLLDADEKKNTENSPNNNVVSMRMQPIEDNAETIQNFDEADLEHFFDDDDDFGMQIIEDNAETIQTADGVGLTQFFEDDGEPEMEDLECLKKFRHQSFRKKQWDIIKSLREGRDVCAVMATGYGKSLCFQFPAVRSKKMTLVVSPLISLMEAQVVDLTKIGISACFVGSAQYDTSILYKIERGHFTVIYCSPEYLQGSNGPRLLLILRNKLALIAVDEAHCLSQWGHDFRPDFRKLNILRQKFPATPILAVTATATENVRYDIATLLRLNEPRVILTSFDRPNLELIIKRKTTVMADLLPLIRDVDGSIIVYVLRRVDAEDVANELIYNGVICMPYHGGQEKPRRSEVLRKFMNDESKVIVATIAFGMGIDKKDVRLVIHYGASKNLEGYYQEVGRAGRDGKASKVITFFSPNDFELHDWFLDQKSKKSHLTAVIKNYLRSLGAKMRDFLYTTKCRRKIILDYFGENTSLTPRPNCCDNCTMGLGSWRLTDLYEDIDDDGIYDFSAEAKILLDAIKCLKLNGISTEKKLLKQFLIGQYDRRLQKVRRHRCYESGSSHPQHYWLALSEQLSQNGYIDAITDEPRLTLTQKAENWLQNGGSLRLKAIGQMFEYFDRKRSTPLVVGQVTMNRHNVTRTVTDLMRKDYVLSDELLKQILSEVRDAVYVLSANILDKNSIATMGDMEKMVKARPKNLDEFRFAMKGTFSEEKVNKFGPTFVNAVSRFTSAQLEMQNVLLNNPMPDVNMNRVVSPQILHLIKDRKSKDEIIELTNLTERQLFDDIATLIQTGQPIQKTDIAYMSHIDFKVLSGLISNTTNNITAVEQVDEMTTKYVQTTSEPMDSGFVRLGLMYYAVRFHLNRLSVPYVDCEQNVLVNAEKLIAEERSETLNTDFRTDRQYAPYRTNYYGAGGSIVEFLFGGFMGGHFSYGDVYDAHDYEEYEHYYGGASISESYGSDYENEEEQEEASEQEREEASEQERDEASVQERDEVSAQERDEVSAQERDEASAQERDEASEQERDEEDSEASDRENDQESVDSSIVSDESSVIEDEEESGTDTEESYTDVSDTEDDSDDDDTSDSDFEYESARRNYGQKRRRV